MPILDPNAPPPYGAKEIAEMGTRSLIRVFDNEREVACIYQQFDGYLSGVGSELAKFVNSQPFVNGIGENSEVFNGMGCFAAQLIRSLKAGAGGVYMYPAGSTNVGEEYVYSVHGGIDRQNGLAPQPVSVKVESYGKQIFVGTPAEFLAFCERDEEAEA